MKSCLQKMLSLSAAVVFGGTAVAVATPFLYHADFSGPDGTMPDDWVRLTNVDGFYLDDGEFVFDRADSSSSGAARTAVHDSGLARFWEDYTVEVWFMANRQHDRDEPHGIVARWQGVTPQSSSWSGYFAYWDGNVLNIDRDFTSAGAGTNLVSTPLSQNLEQGVYYRLRFTLEGANLHAEIFHPDGLSLASVSATDSTYSAGTAGLRSNHSFHTRNTRFRDFTVEGTHGAPADLLHAESFVGEDGGFPAEWEQIPEVDFMDFHNLTFRMRRIASEDSETSDSGWNRTIGYRGADALEWSDYVTEVWFTHSRQHDATDRQGVIARWQGNVPTLSDGHGYVAQHRGESGGPGSLQIVRDLARSGSDNILASVALDESLVQNGWYRLRFAVEGPDLTAEIFRSDGVRIGHVSTWDSTYTKGSVAVRAGIGFRNRTTRFSGLVVTGEAPAEITPGDIFWATSTAIRSSRFDGSETQTVVSGIGRPIGLAVDFEAELLYWVEHDTGRLMRSDTTGRNIVELRSDLQTPQFLALDGGDLYWTEWNEGLFSSPNDGSGRDNVVHSPFNGSAGVALTNDQAFFVSANTGDVISYNRDGSGFPETVTTFAGQTYGIAIDPSGQELYATNFSDNWIRVYDLDTGGEPRTVWESDLSRPLGLAVSSDGQQLFWAERTWDEANGRIRVASSDGTGEITTLVEGEASPFGIAVRPVGTTPSGFFAWIAGFDLPAEQSEPADNPSGDGIANLIKYALGLDPAESARGMLPQAVVAEIEGAPHLSLTIERNPEAVDIALTFEVSSDLVEWSSDESDVIVVEEGNTLTGWSVQRLDEGDRLFMRVSVGID